MCFLKKLSSYCIVIIKSLQSQQKVHLILFWGRFWIRQGFHELVKRVGGLSPSPTHTVIITGKENNNFAVAA